MSLTEDDLEPGDRMRRNLEQALEEQRSMRPHVRQIFTPVELKLMGRMRDHPRIWVFDAGPRSEALRNLEKLGVASVVRGEGRWAGILIGSMVFDPDQPPANPNPVQPETPYEPGDLFV